ncbi:MAG: transcriptional regulator [Micrococcaceae bacterium]
MLVLHAVRLTGFADTGAVTQRAGTSHDATLRMLRQAKSEGWVQYMSFADLAGWSLTDAGKVENERQLAEELREVDPHDTVVRTVYHQFLPLNARLLREVTDWQIRPSEVDPYAPNDHTDLTWDGRILDHLASLGSELRPLVERLATVLARFDGYGPRYDAALLRARNGEVEWIDKTSVDSCHRVWFQLHEDLIATLGIDRQNEV